MIRQQLKNLSKLGEMLLSAGEVSDLGMRSYDTGELLQCEDGSQALIVQCNYEPHLGWTYDVLIDGELYKDINESVLDSRVVL
tara:strand:+ start:250 stop:498 length:249 start_codon:yes stop_codon:yes gene_type:complete